MAELTPEQIAKGYYTDISGIGTAIDKVQEQEALRAKAKQAQQDKLYQGIKDISGVFDNKYAATGTSADPILLGKINKQKNDLIEGLMSGKVSPSSAYMMASSGVADINNLAGTISQYRLNTEKKINELKKDRPELNTEKLLNDSIKTAIYNPETGEIVSPNANYDYTSTLLSQDNGTKYVDQDLLNQFNQEEWKKYQVVGTPLGLGGGLVAETKLRPGQMVVPGKGGGLDIDFASTPVGSEFKEKLIKKNGKTITEKVNVGLFPGASDELINYFEPRAGLKRAASYQVSKLDNIAKSNEDFGKKWNTLTPEEKYKVAVLDYAKNNLGKGGSEVSAPRVSAEAQLANMRRRGSGDGRADYVNPIEAMISDFVANKGNVSQERLLSHFPGEGVFMGYANQYDPQSGQILTVDSEDGGKGVKVYGYPEITKEGKLILKPFERYLSEGLRWDRNTPIGEGKGYDLLNKNRFLQEADQMLNIYGRLNNAQPSIYTKP